MNKDVYEIAAEINKLHKEAFVLYEPIVKDICRREATETEVSCLLDYLLGFACDDKLLELYKNVCRRYLNIYPECIYDYVSAYKEMWEKNNDYEEI